MGEKKSTRHTQTARGKEEIEPKGRAGERSGMRSLAEEIEHPSSKVYVPRKT